MTQKTCTKCGEIKALNEFSKHKKSKDGFQYWCKPCQTGYDKQRYRKNREREIQRVKQWAQENKERVSVRSKNYYRENKRVILEKGKKYRQETAEYQKRRRKRYYQENEEKICENQKQYYEALSAGVYAIYNQKNNKVYIGQSTAYRQRWASHKSALKYERHRNTALQADYDKCGLHAFEFKVIEELPCDTSSDILVEIEERLIQKYISEGKELYNQISLDKQI